MRFKYTLMIVMAICAQGFPLSTAKAEGQPYSSMLSGPLGLNTIPSARMDQVGTIRAGASTLDPYVHGFVGFQLADPLYINIRQTAEVSNINEEADRLYPGVDLKLRLLKESWARPEIAVGLNSIVGHKRMASEYIALSKRYHDFDLTAGLGWGRMGSAAHFKNPLKGLMSHFGKARALDGEMPNEPQHWFTGETVGFFGGVEYFTPVEGLSLKLDYGADRYETEQADFNYDVPAPWSAGLAYTSTPWMNMSIAMQGTDKVMGRLSLNTLLSDWPDRTTPKENAKPLRPYRTDLALPAQMDLSGQGEGMLLTDTKIALHSAETRLVLEPHNSTPYQIGRAALHMSNHAGPAIEKLTVNPTILGLQGPSVSLMRRDLENAGAHHKGSTEEIWHNAELNSSKIKPFKKLKRYHENALGLQDFELILDNQISLAEEDSGTLYRTSLVAGKRWTKFFGFLDVGYAVRINLEDNLDRLEEIRPRSFLPVRSDIDKFAERTFSVDKFYHAFTHSFRPDLHLSLIGGYLEEMYAGLGGELLYRPFGSRFAIGLESWQAFKRDPYTDWNLGLNGDHVLTGHLNAWYDIPHHDLTIQARAGRHLAEDIGATVALHKRFRNGANLEGFVTVSDSADFDLFGGTTHAYHGVRLSLPLGGFKYAPQGASINFKAEPFGRDIGQAIDSPLPLYELTQPFSYEHLAEYWDQITTKTPAQN